MSRETTPTKPWADQVDHDQPRTSPNDSTNTPKISAGWKRQLLMHAESRKKQAEKEIEKQKKVEEWRTEEKKKVIEARASPDKGPATLSVRSPGSAVAAPTGTSPSYGVNKRSDRDAHTPEHRTWTSRSGNRTYDSTPENRNDRTPENRNDRTPENRTNKTPENRTYDRTPENRTNKTPENRTYDRTPENRTNKTPENRSNKTPENRTYDRTPENRTNKTPENRSNRTENKTPENRSETRTNKTPESRPYSDRRRGDRARDAQPDKYGPSRRPEVDADRWSRGGHSHRGRGRGRTAPHREAEHVIDHPAQSVEVDVVTRDPVTASPSTRADARAVLSIDVELESGSLVQLLVHEHEDVQRLARDFCTEHVIDRALLDLFVQEIETQLAAMRV